MVAASVQNPDHRRFAKLSCSQKKQTADQPALNLAVLGFLSLSA